MAFMIGIYLFEVVDSVYALKLNCATNNTRAQRKGIEMNTYTLLVEVGNRRQYIPVEAAGIEEARQLGEALYGCGSVLSVSIG